MFFIGAVLATDSECIINICVILGRGNLFEMAGAVRSARDQWRSARKFFCVYRPYKHSIRNKQ